MAATRPFTGPGRSGARYLGAIASGRLATSAADEGSPMQTLGRTVLLAPDDIADIAVGLQ